MNIEIQSFLNTVIASHSLEPPICVDNTFVIAFYLSKVIYKRRLKQPMRMMWFGKREN